MRVLYSIPLLLIGGAAMAQPGAALVDPEPLASRSLRSFEPMALSRSLVQSPRLVSREDRTVLAWVEPDADGRDRVYSLSLRDERQQDYPIEKLIVAIDGEEGSHSSAPAVALAADGRTSAWAWVTTIGEEQVVCVRRGAAAPEVVASTGGVVDFPALDFDQSGNLYVTWTQQLGSRTEAWVAWHGLGESAPWTTRRLAGDGATCDLLPNVFGNGDSADLFWYSLDGSEIALHRLELAPGRESLPDTLVDSDIPAYRLPILYRAGTGAPGALWIEPTDGGEVYMALDPRRSASGPEVVGMIGAPPAIATVSADTRAALAWVERSTGTTTLVAENPHGAILRQPVGDSVTAPQLAVSRGWTNLAWVEPDAASGLSTLSFLRVR